MVAQIAEESNFFPQNERRHKEAGHFGIPAQLSGWAGCHSGQLMSVAQDLPHPAVSVYMRLLQDLLKSGPDGPYAS